MEELQANRINTLLLAIQARSLFNITNATCPNCAKRANHALCAAAQPTKLAFVLHKCSCPRAEMELMPTLLEEALSHCEQLQVLSHDISSTCMCPSAPQPCASASLVQEC